MKQPITPATPCRHQHAAAFTLIELFIVTAILVALVSMLMPMIRIADRMSKATATRAVMAKVDAACRLFRSELGPYPYQPTYADLAAGEAWTNRLYYQLGTDIAKDDRAKVVADADSAASLYAPNHPLAYDFTNADTTPSCYLTLPNRMAAERARLAIFSGHVGIAGPKLRVPFHHWYFGTLITRRVMPSDPLLSPSGTPPRRSVSHDRPGLAKDYLFGEIPANRLSGEAILDAWGRPLLYVCQVVEGMRSVPYLESVGRLNPVDMGLQALGRTSLNAERIDQITSEPVVADPGLPDPAVLRHSDRRTHAPVGLELSFELWSAGPDGRADWMRDGLGNADNIALSPYDAAIP